MSHSLALAGALFIRRHCTALRQALQPSLHAVQSDGGFTLCMLTLLFWLGAAPAPAQVREEEGQYLAMTEDDIMTLKEFKRKQEIIKAEAEAEARARGEGQD